jgi:hypothetical protein
MSYIKLSISFLTAFCFLAACSQADKSQCACLEQAQKVNRLSEVVWSSSATHNDTLLLKAALEKKASLCKKLQESAPEALQDLKAACQQ